MSIPSAPNLEKFPIDIRCQLDLFVPQFIYPSKVQDGGPSVLYSRSPGNPHRYLVWTR